MTETAKSPCKECLCVPICRSKCYVDILDHCDIAHNYLYQKDYELKIYMGRRDYWNRVRMVCEDLSTKVWSVSEFAVVEDNGPIKISYHHDNLYGFKTIKGLKI
ncbi:MAG: hypothetical protein ACTSW1_07765 [Candidatus Hodarchaeales archaeon]